MTAELGYRVPKHKKIPCPECGQPMDERAKRCRTCYESARVCPSCGGPKDHRAKMCATCRGHGKKMTRYDTCPDCGKRKYKKARLCYACTHQPPGPVPKTGIRKTQYLIQDMDRDWLLQFTGFFMADGCVTFSSAHQPRPTLVINLRADDRPWLEDICTRLGGKLYEYDPQASTGSKAQCRWSAYGWTRVYPIICMMLDICTIHTRKQRELQIAREWCEWRMAWGNRLTDEGHRTNRDYSKRLSEAKVFKVHPG